MVRFPCASRAKIGQVSGGNGQGPAFLLSPLGDLVTLFINFSNAARPFGGSLISHFGQFAHVLTHGCQILERTPVYGSGQFPAIPFISSTRPL